MILLTQRKGSAWSFQTGQPAKRSPGTTPRRKEAKPLIGSFFFCFQVIC